MDTNTRYGALFGYYFIDRFTEVNPYASATVPGFSAGSNGQTQLANLGITTTLNNSTVNDARLVYIDVYKRQG